MAKYASNMATFSKLLSKKMCVKLPWRKKLYRRNKLAMLRKVNFPFQIQQITLEIISKNLCMINQWQNYLSKRK